jgi:hypothetical protein
MHPRDQISTFSLYSNPNMVSIPLYSRVCIFSVKCLSFQHAFPKSTIFIEGLSNGIKRDFHIKLCSEETVQYEDDKSFSIFYDCEESFKSFFFSFRIYKLFLTILKSYLFKLEISILYLSFS